MPTFLFDQIVFGPVKSRRLGLSLGINLLPKDCKYCNFDCIYCECGWNASNRKTAENSFPGRKEISQALEQKLIEMKQSGQLPDSITFAGNGEPTIHPAFAGIIDDTVALRNTYAPESRISVLSNATMLHRPEIIEALKKVDFPILKLDSAIPSTIHLLNRPAKKILLPELISALRSFHGQCIIQTMFIKGTYNGRTIDNTTAEELDAWENAILEINPRQVMIYTIARDTPVETLQKVEPEKLEEIAQRIRRHGIQVQISA